MKLNFGEKLKNSSSNGFQNQIEEEKDNERFFRNEENSEAGE